MSVEHPDTAIDAEPETEIKVETQTDIKAPETETEIKTETQAEIKGPDTVAEINTPNTETPPLEQAVAKLSATDNSNEEDDPLPLLRDKLRLDDTVAEINTPNTETPPLEQAVAKLSATADNSKEEDDPLPLLRDRLRPDAFDVELNVQQNSKDNPLYSVVDFEHMGLRPELLQGIYAAKFVKPSKVQSTAIPMIIADPPQNLIGQSQSGTGKTAAFVLGMLSRIDPAVNAPQALCIAPTRELVRQIYTVVKLLGQHSGISVRRMIKDERIPMGKKITDQLIIGTSGRVMDIMRRNILPSADFKIFVVDEADVMLDIQGMGDQSKKIRRSLPAKCQILLFSATFKPKVREFALALVPEPNIIQLKREELSLEGIKQFYINCGSLERKFDVLSDLYAFMTIGQSIIFVHTRRTASNLASQMTARGHAVSMLYGGDMEGAVRDRVIDDFREGKSKVLITTNVLARGIDILQVSLVINYDLPLTADNKPDPETYLHRIGRSGRFGRKGTAINLVHDQLSLDNVTFFQQFYGREIEDIPLDAIEHLEGILNK